MQEHLLASPDLNPIENIWYVFKNLLGKCLPVPKTRDELARAADLTLMRDQSSKRMEGMLSDELNHCLLDLVPKLRAGAVEDLLRRRCDIMYILSGLNRTKRNQKCAYIKTKLSELQAKTREVLEARQGGSQPAVRGGRSSAETSGKGGFTFRAIESRRDAQKSGSQSVSSAFVLQPHFAAECLLRGGPDEMWLAAKAVCSSS
ncbi:uncharacterized protein UBRO_21079 [Ustilago bromivora]|uniref:Uncharacterized protein n=1 Tax=Ustilago bromivora TaxID=307758 RepID=A0A1K0G8E7_9BASI|nr:uncharacterized protein UBRO_21079 [Ustilago bromivora]